MNERNLSLPARLTALLRSPSARRLAGPALLVTALGLAPFAALEERRPWRVPSRKASVANPLTSSATLLAKGKALYAQECATCHGNDGQGQGPGARDVPGGVPPFRELPGQSDGALFYKISSGRDPMPGYRHSLDDEERWQTVLYLRELAPPPLSKPSLTASADETAAIDRALRSYVAMTTALAQESLAQVHGEGRALLAGLEAAGSGSHERWPTLTTPLSKRAGALAAAEDIDSARASFEVLSRDMQSWLEAFGHGSEQPVLVLQTTLERKTRRWIADAVDSPNPFGRKASSARCVQKLAGQRDDSVPEKGVRQ